jgi:hypothetical protein
MAWRVTDQPLVADFDAQGVEKNQRIHRLEQPVLPFGDCLPNRVEIVETRSGESTVLS